MKETYNYNNSNSSNNSKCLKFINFFINNRSIYFEQFTKKIMIVKSIFYNTKIDKILDILFE